MLHEVLLGLSGHPSPIFEPGKLDDFPLTTDAERALLGSLGHLATLHRLLREHLASISTDHPSVICRATASSIRRDHLTQFQEHIVNVERNVLLKDPSSVGAYDIVPLSAIVNDFEPWRRRLDWYWELACFMQPHTDRPVSVNVTSRSCSNGVQLIDKLRLDAQTGFKDIEGAARQLSGVAEKAWVRMLVQWLANSSMPHQGANDFFIASEIDDSFGGTSVRKDLLPTFLAEETARSIIFIGKTIAKVSSDIDSNTQSALTNGATRKGFPSPAKPSSLPAAFIQSLGRLQYPLAASGLSGIVAQCRTMLAQEVIDKVLPAHQLIFLLDMLRQFFLAGRVDFVDALIHEADSFIANRHRQLQAGGRSQVSATLAGVMIKEGEVKAVLTRTFTSLAPFISKDSLVDESLDWARDHTMLTVARANTRKASSSRNMDLHFKDHLLLTSTELTVRLDPRYELFLGTDEMECYSAIQAYLLSIRRGHNHLTDLWRISSFRRDCPAPIRSRREKSNQAFENLKATRQVFLERTHALKRVWSSCGAAASLLAELGSFLSTETIEGSWASFRRWATQQEDAKKRTLGSGHEIDDFSTTMHPPTLPHDPETLARGHRKYIRSLVDMLLLSDYGFTKALRAFLAHSDQVVALMYRLHTVQKNVNLQEEGVFEDRKVEYAREEKQVVQELNQNAQALNKAMCLLIDKLRDASSSIRQQPRHASSTASFQPVNNAASIDRLLVRLEQEASAEQNDHS